MEFVALGHSGSDHYAGLETFPNPGVTRVTMTSDELVAVCPITDQPDFYTAAIGRHLFFEILERRGGYSGLGAPNASVRMAAQSRSSHI
jgi:hypothetical protein